MFIGQISGLNLVLLIIVVFLILLFIFIIAKNSRIQNIVFGIVIVIAVGVYASTNLFENEAIKTDDIGIPNIDTQEKLLTLNYNSTNYNFSLNDLISSFKPVSGLGNKINQIGKISGPNNYTGIPMSLVLQSLKDLPDNYWLMASASDYEYNFSKENVSGKVELYNENSGSYGIGNMTMILAYKINDKSLDETNGGPLRIVFIDDKGSITYSSMWVSSVNKLVVIKSENNTIKNSNIPPFILINVSNCFGNAPLSVYFYGNFSDPDGNITSFKWDFGDGSSDDKKDSYHIYKKAGSYNAFFKVTDNNGINSTEIVQINISYFVVDGCISPTDFYDPNTDWDSPEYAFDDNLYTFAKCKKKGFWNWRWTGYLELIPPISFECNKIRFKAWYDFFWCNEINIDVFFNNTWNNIFQGTYKNKEWETIEFPLNYVSKVRVRFHLFQRFIGITAELYEFDFYIETNNIPPVADFSFYPTNPNKNQNIYFSDESYDNDGKIVSWKWDFGDGTELVNRNPTYAYSNFGYYEVRLTVTDDEGATNSISKYISIGNQKPNADFSYTPVKPTIENKVYFLDKSTDVDGYITSWLWDFGDGYSSPERKPSHQYINTGTYIVKLSVKDNDEGISEIIKNIILSEQNGDAILTLIYNEDQIIYTLGDLENMVSITGWGGRLNSVGSIAGPFEYKGVPISALANEFSLNPTSYTLTTISDDGYTYNYTQDEIQGNIQVYDTEGNKIGIGGVTMILAYDEEGIKDFPGGPLRIAYVDDEEQLTDSFLWSKHVIEIEFF